MPRIISLTLLFAVITLPGQAQSWTGFTTSNGTTRICEYVQGKQTVGLPVRTVTLPGTGNARGQYVGSVVHFVMERKGGTATPNVDFELPSPWKCRATKGNCSLTVNPVKDSIPEDDETINIEIVRIEHNGTDVTANHELRNQYHTIIIRNGC